jgi:hypothetical protein
MGISGGINYISGAAAALGGTTVALLDQVNSIGNTLQSLIGPYRPQKWSNPPVTSITVPATQGSPGSSSTGSGSLQSVGTGIGGTNTATSITDIGVQGTPGQIFNVSPAAATSATIYVFDAVFELEHTQDLQPTELPVQSGANITDHVFIKPARLTLEIGMSDVMSSYTPGQWSGASSKSVNAYQILLQLSFTRTALTITTKLRTYTNCVITSIRARDNYKTINSLRAVITFQQIFNALSGTNQNPVSSRNQDTQITQQGQVPTTGVPDVVSNNYSVPNQYLSNSGFGQNLQTTPVGTVLGGGDYGSSPWAITGTSTGVGAQ